jgi:hypothetical protein
MRRARPLLLSLLWASAAAAGAESLPKPPTDFVRYVEDSKGAALQTGIARYRAPNGANVDLIGAIHIADKAYYEALNERFTHYDAVLYELVGRPVEEREEVVAGDGNERLRWLGQLQEGMRTSLELESQLKVIDYTAKNFVHADMSIEGFFESQQAKNESFLGLWWRAIKAQDLMENASKPSPGLGKILELLCRKDSATGLKRLIASQFDTVENLVAGIETEGGTAIIGERNKHALDVLDHELKSGKRNLAIFYGAAHLADMESRLLKKGYELERVEYLNGWNLPPEPSVTNVTPAKTSVPGTP